MSNLLVSKFVVFTSFLYLYMFLESLNAWRTGMPFADEILRSIRETLGSIPILSTFVLLTFKNVL